MGLSIEQIHIGLTAFTALTLLFSILGLSGTYALTGDNIWSEYASGSAVNAVRTFLVFEITFNVLGLVLIALKRFKFAGITLLITAFFAMLAFSIAVGQAFDVIKTLYGLGWGCSFEITAFVFALVAAGGSLYAHKQE